MIVHADRDFSLSASTLTGRLDGLDRFINAGGPVDGAQLVGIYHANSNT